MPVFTLSYVISYSEENAIAQLIKCLSTLGQSQYQNRNQMRKKFTSQHLCINEIPHFLMNYMSYETLIAVLLRQFNNSWDLLSQAMDQCGDYHWFQILSDDEKTYWVYSLTVYHILETSEFYFRTSPEEMEWGQKGNMNWNDDSTLETKIENLTKEFLSQYLVEMREKTKDLFEELTQDHLLSKDDFPWFPSVCDKLLYLLRHNMMHIGELNKSLREWNSTRIKWQ